MVLSEFMPGKMYAVEKKLEIEMKLKKEMTNIEELKAATKRSSAIANDVCNVLGACEQRLQQLESAVLPLYGDTARLQHIHQNKLAEAQNYFNKNNPQSVELENINQLYNSGVLKLETAFEELLSRNTRPLSPTTLMDMIAIEEDSSADSVSVGGSQPAGGAADAMRAAAAWLSAAGRPPAAPLVAVRAPAALASLNNFRHYLRSRSMAASPLRGKKNLNRTDSTTRRTSKIQKVIEKRAINIMMKASQTLEQSTGLAIGPRRSLSEPYMEEFSEAVEEHEADAAGTLAVALCRVVRCEQRHALGLVPLPRLPALLTAITSQCIKLLATEVEKACARSRKGAARCSAGAAACWGLLARLQRLAADVARALHPASAAPYAALVASAQQLVLAQLNLALRSKSEQYPDALKAIFLLNNTLYLLQGLQRSGLIEVLKVSEPGCEGHYRDMIHSHKTAYLQSWSKLLSYLVLEEPLPAKLRDKDRQMLKDKFSRGYAVPEREVRESLKREVAAALLPAYSALHARATAAPFAKNPDKYVKYTPVQVTVQYRLYRKRPLEDPVSPGRWNKPKKYVPNSKETVKDASLPVNNSFKSLPIDVGEKSSAHYQNAVKRKAANNTPLITIELNGKIKEVIFKYTKDFHMQYRGRKLVKVQCYKSETHQKVKEGLLSENVYFHTHARKDEKHPKAIIKGLPKFAHDNIPDELDALGFNGAKVCPSDNGTTQHNNIQDVETVEMMEILSTIQTVKKEFRKCQTFINKRELVDLAVCKLNADIIALCETKLTKRLTLDIPGVVIYSVYQSPNLPLIKSDLDLLMSSGSKVVVMGDLNSKHPLWSPGVGKTLYEHMVANDYTIHAPRDCTLVDYTPDLKPSTPDLLLAKNSYPLEKIPTVAALFSNHFPVLAKFTTKLQRIQIRKLNFAKADWNKYRNYLNSNTHLSSQTFKSPLEIDEAISKFQKSLLQARDLSVPFSSLTPWSSLSLPRRIKRLIKHKNRLRRYSLLETNLLVKRILINRINQLKSQIRIAITRYNDYKWDLKLKRVDNPSSDIWRLVKGLRSNSTNPIPALHLENGLVTNTIQEQFNLLDCCSTGRLFRRGCMINERYYITTLMLWCYKN
ncbi:unnamed protein product, partial [Leptidea sinapis]